MGCRRSLSDRPQSMKKRLIEIGQNTSRMSVVPSEVEKGAPIAPTGYRAKKGVLVARFATVSKRRLPASVRFEKVPIIREQWRASMEGYRRYKNDPDWIHVSGLFQITLIRRRRWRVTHMVSYIRVDLGWRLTLRQAKTYVELLLQRTGEDFWKSESYEGYNPNALVGKRRRPLLDEARSLLAYVGATEW